MRTIKIQTKVSGMSVSTQLANPAAPLGYNKPATVGTFEITEIPESVENWQVVKRFSETSILFCPRHSFVYTEIGGGRIIRK